MYDIINIDAVSNTPRTGELCPKIHLFISILSTVHLVVDTKSGVLPGASALGLSNAALADLSVFVIVAVSLRFQLIEAGFVVRLPVEALRKKKHIFGSMGKKVAEI